MRVKENLLTESIPFPKKELFLHVICVEYLDKYQLKLTFNNGIEGIVDLEQELYGEIFEPLKDQSLFQKVYVNSRTIEWPNGADFAPEFLLEIALDKHPVSMVGDRVGYANEM